MKIQNNFLFCFILILVLRYSNCSAQELHGSVTIPKYAGGLSALQEFIHKNIVYPKGSTEEIISGVVTVSYTIDESGKIEDIKVIRGLNQALDNEAIRITQLITGWQPAIRFGEPVRVRVNMPIEFVLDNNTSKNNSVVSGVVVNKSDGKPIRGTLVLVKGSSNGCITDTNGYYELTVPEEESEIEFSSLGYETKLEKAGKNHSINVELRTHDFTINFSSGELK